MEPQRVDFKRLVLDATELVELVGKTVSLKKAGKSYVGLCPFHSEKSPSFSVDPGKQFFHCFGCKASGNAIDFVMKRDRIEFVEAMNQLGAAAGLERPNGSSQSRQQAGERQQLLSACSTAAGLFEKLLAHPTAGAAGRAYLAERGFNDAAVRKFQIGLAADAWDALLRADAMRAFSPQILATAGLVKPRQRDDGRIDGYYDTFRNRLMFPIRDENARIIAFGGRVMPGSEDKAKYLNSPETPLFNKSRVVFGLDQGRQKIVETRTVAVVEGYADVVMAHQFGATNVVSPLGTALTESHVSILRRFADRIVLLFDADAAGDTAVNRAVELFLTQPVEIAIASLPDGLDPDEYLLAHGAEAFDAVLKGAADALTFKWKQLYNRFSTSGDDLTARQKAAQEYLELLATARGAGPVDALRWGSALARVSRLTEIPVEDLNRQFRYKPQRSPPSRPSGDAPRSNGPIQSAATGVPRPKPAGPRTARDRAERWILAVLLVEPHRWADLQHHVGPADFTDEQRRQLAELYWHHQRDEGEPVFNEFLGTLPDADVAELAIGLVEEFETLEEPGVRVTEALSLFAELRERQERQKLLAQLRRTNDSGDAGATGPTAGDSLRQLQEKARQPDLRRVGS